MKFVFLASLLTVGLSAFAGAQYETFVACTPKYFSCTPAFCGWEDGVSVPEQTVKMVEDLNYPNKAYPFVVWRGTYRANLDGHTLTLDIMKTDDRNKPVSVNALLSTPNVSAESQGTDSVTVSLRNANYGRGFSCLVER